MAFPGSRSSTEKCSAPNEAAGVARCTESGRWLVLWRLDRHCVRIIEVRDEYGGPVKVAGADLAEMRERYPDLTPLWDAVRHDLWTSVASVAGRR